MRDIKARSGRYFEIFMRIGIEMIDFVELLFNLTWSPDFKKKFKTR